MATSTREVTSFPAISLPSAAGGAPVEVALIAQLGIGAGNRLIADTGRRQTAHPEFIDALDEPSTRLGGMHLAQGDASSLYSFVVGPSGHPFHRHATPRTFTAIAGSGGAELRFSTVSASTLEQDPAAFLAALRIVTIPPDCLFTVRFGGGTWHQFVPRRRGHPALFALSCHTNELGGELAEAERTQVSANRATIPSLTEVVPADVQSLLERTDLARLPNIALALHAAPASPAARVCSATRHWVGSLRARLGAAAPGFLSRSESGRAVTRRRGQPEGSLLDAALPARCRHDDHVSITLDRSEVARSTPSDLLARVLEGFLENRPLGVSRLMALRNVAVAPMKLRTSPMGCPVSSLLSGDRSRLFAGRFPVLDQDIGAVTAQVLLGADDRHLMFRTCVRVQLNEDGSADVGLGSRVFTRNLFGRLYMAAIDHTHRLYVAPSLLRMAVDHALAPELSANARDAARPGAIIQAGSAP